MYILDHITQENGKWFAEIKNEEITYCDDFNERYKDFIRRTQMFNPDMIAEKIATKEDYYWQCWKVH